MTYPRIREMVRPALEEMNVNDTVTFPMVHRSSVAQEMEDLKLFGDRLYTSKADKIRSELVVRRIK